MSSVTSNKQKQNKDDKDRFSNISLKLIKVVVWLFFLYLSTFYNFQNLYFILSGILYIFMNLGKRKSGEMSAYSVFNKNFKKPAGSMDAEQMILGTSKRRSQQRIFGQEQQKQAKKVDQYFKNQSKYGNKPCYCDSGLKFKKCCLIKNRNQNSKKNKQL